MATECNELANKALSYADAKHKERVLRVNDLPYVIIWLMSDRVKVTFYTLDSI